MSGLEIYKQWLEGDGYDEETKEELRSIAGNEQEIEDRFYKELEFGTGGLRGILGAGTNRMNRYTVCRATQGLADYIKREKGESKGVVIAYDSRHCSAQFAMESALCLAANGIHAYVFDALRPTPELSFALRYLGCIAGIVITASHNPPEYNGYKVYWEDGAQITPPRDGEIIECVRNVTDYTSPGRMSEEDAARGGLLTIIGSEIDDAYVKELKKLTESSGEIQQYAEELRIVYTPLHGTGNVLVRRVLRELGFEQVFVVPRQEKPDGDFPTVSYPNPEDEKAFALALELAREKQADIVLATDPDADRLGVYAKDARTGRYMPFTGNMSGMLICEYLLARKRKKGTLAGDGAIVKTIVTTNMADAVAKEYGMKLIETLTGFKYIGEQIHRFEMNKTATYVFGFEESYGCLVGTHARDKDAVAAVMMLCEAAAYYRSIGKTLWDAMMDMYEKYGYYMEGLSSVTHKGREGNMQIEGMMNRFRNNPPAEIAGSRVLKVRDYASGQVTDIMSGRTFPTGLNSSNVLYYEMEDDGWFCVRPSGTEPKVKFYYGVKGSSYDDAVSKIEALKKYVTLL